MTLSLLSVASKSVKKKALFSTLAFLVIVVSIGRVEVGNNISTQQVLTAFRIDLVWTHPKPFLMYCVE